MRPSSLPRVQGRHRRGNKWRYAAPVLGYSVAAALAVVAATSAHYGQLRSEDVGSSSLTDHTRTHAERQQGYLPPIARSTGGAGESAPPAPPVAFQPAPPAPTEPAQAKPEAASPQTPSDEETARSTPSERATAPVSDEPAPTETSEPATTSEPTATSEPTEPSEPSEPSEPTIEPTPPPSTEEPQPRLLKGVDGVVHGLTDPVLGLLG